LGLTIAPRCPAKASSIGNQKSSIVNQRAGETPALPGYGPNMKDAITEGVRLFNTQKFFEAHEALEAVWLKAHGVRKTVLQGVIQVAAAFHHRARRNHAGFRSLLEKGCTKLERFEVDIDGLDLVDLLEQLRPWRERLHRTGAQASHEGLLLPQIGRRQQWAENSRQPNCARACPWAKAN
jgi:uncharacterized protein